MYPLFKFISLILVSIFLYSGNAWSLNKDQLMSSFLSVVMIRGYNDAGGLAYGSGVVVGDNQVITNCHV